MEQNANTESAYINGGEVAVEEEESPEMEDSGGGIQLELPLEWPENDHKRGL